MSEELLGAGHNKIVEDLLARLDEIKDPNCHKPRVVVLRGASGVGKTRIVQEVYERLRQRGADAYWPEMVPAQRVGRGAGVDPMPGRKLVAPGVEGLIWPASVLPTFGWWGLSCERLTCGERQDVVAAVSPQALAHAFPLALAKRQAESLSQKAARLGVDVVEEVRKALLEEGADAALERLEALVADSPVVPSVVKAGLKGLKKAREWHQGRKLLRTEVPIGEGVSQHLSSAGVELADAFFAMAHADLPAVVAVEDAHHMGPELSSFLLSLAARWSAPVLVVATVWPEGQDSATYLDWFKQAQDRGQVEVVDVPVLGPGDLVTLVRSYAPNTAVATADEVVTRLGNPHWIKLWLTEKRTQKHIAENGQALASASGDTWIPNSIRQVVSQRWDELEAEVQEGLLYAAAVNPDPEDAVCRFLPEVVAQVYANKSAEPVLDVRKGLERAVEPMKWCRMDEGTELFAELLLADHARGRSRDRFENVDIEQLRLQAREALRGWINEHRGMGLSLPDTVAASLVSSWYTRLQDSAPGQGGGSDKLVLAAALWRQATEAADRKDPQGALKIKGQVAQLLESEYDCPEVAVVDMEVAAAWWMLDSGQDGASLKAFRRVVQDARRVYGAEDPRSLDVRAGLIEAMVRQGEVKRAVDLYKDLITQQTRVFGPGSDEVLRSKQGLARALKEVGSRQDASILYEEIERSVSDSPLQRQLYSLPLAIARADLIVKEKDKKEVVAKYKSLLERQERLFGMDNSNTLIARGNLAKALQRAYDLSGAIREYQRLRDAQVRLLGSRHPDTLVTRGEIASALVDIGHDGEAVEACQELLPDMVRVLGLYHYRTLFTWHNLVWALGNVGRAGEAIKASQELLPDLVRVLGPDHHQTLATRSNLASVLCEAGRVDEAIRVYQELLPDLVRVLGPDHVNTLNIRSNLADLFSRARRSGEAVDAYQKVLPDYARVLGPHHFLTLTARVNLARTLVWAGRATEAVEAYEELLPDLVRVLGPDHPNTLTARSNLASALSGAGRLGEAVDAYQKVLPDLVRVRGADHPQTLAARHNMAGALGQVGRVGEALAAYEELFPDQLRVRGADHPDTLTTRSGLAGALGQVGRVDEAVAAYEELFPDQLRVLGADHPHTLTTRGNLAWALGQVGRVGEAVAAYEELLPDLVRVLGTDHPDTLITRGNLAGALGQVGRVDEAVAACEELLADRVRVLGADHPDTLTTRGNLAGALGQVGRVDEAVAAYEELLPDRVRVLGADHPHTLATRVNLAHWLEKADRFPEAIEERTEYAEALEERSDWKKAAVQYRHIIDMQTKAFDPDDREVLATHFSLAYALEEAGQTEEAVQEYTSLKEDQHRVLGPTDPDTLDTRNNLACALHSLNRVQEAIAEYESLRADIQSMAEPDAELLENIDTRLHQWRKGKSQ